MLIQSIISQAVRKYSMRVAETEKSRALPSHRRTARETSRTRLRTQRYRARRSLDQPRTLPLIVENLAARPVSYRLRSKTYQTESHKMVSSSLQLPSPAQRRPFRSRSTTHPELFLDAAHRFESSRLGCRTRAARNVRRAGRLTAVYAARRTPPTSRPRAQRWRFHRPRVHSRSIDRCPPASTRPRRRSACERLCERNPSRDERRRIRRRHWTHSRGRRRGSDGACRARACATTHDNRCGSRWRGAWRGVRSTLAFRLLQVQLGHFVRDELGSGGNSRRSERWEWRRLN